MRIAEVSTYVRPQQPSDLLTAPGWETFYRGHWNSAFEALDQFRSIRLTVEMYFPELSDLVADVYEPLALFANDLNSFQFGKLGFYAQEVLRAQEALLDSIRERHHDLTKARYLPGEF